MTVGVSVLVGVGVAHIHDGLDVAVPLPVMTLTKVAHATVNSVLALTVIISIVELQFVIVNVVPVVPTAPPYKNHAVQQEFVLLGVCVFVAVGVCVCVLVTLGVGV